LGGACGSGPGALHACCCWCTCWYSSRSSLKCARVHRTPGCRGSASYARISS
jgi:hypothetical protein